MFHSWKGVFRKMKQGKITSIGEEAIDKKEKILIFFDDTATEGLRPFSVIQDVPGIAESQVQPGDKISFGEQEYEVTAVGNTALKTLHEIQHVTFVFGPRPEEDSIVNGIYLTPYEVPELAVGMTVTYP